MYLIDKCRMKALELDDNRIWAVALTVPLSGQRLKNKNTNVQRYLQPNRMNLIKNPSIFKKSNIFQETRANRS